jgi:hypothetical protein
MIKTFACMSVLSDYHGPEVSDHTYARRCYDKRFAIRYLYPMPLSTEAREIVNCR